MGDNKNINIKQNIQTIEAEIKDRYEDLVEWQINQALSQQLDKKPNQDVNENGNETQENLRKLEINKRMLYDELEMNINSQTATDIDLPILRRRQDESNIKKENFDVIDESSSEMINTNSVQFLYPADNTLQSSLNFKMRMSIVIILIIFFILT